MHGCGFRASAPTRTRAGRSRGGTQRPGPTGPRKKKSWAAACVATCTRSTSTAATAGFARPRIWSRNMKGKTLVSGTGAAALLAAATLLPGLACAEYVQAQTPFLEGAPSTAFTSQPSAFGSLLDQPSVVWGTSLRVDSLSLSGRGALTIKLSDLD